MWLFTNHGFVSIVRDAQTTGHLLLRFRSREHAGSFHRQLFGDGLALEIRETPQADYRWKFSAPVPLVASHFSRLISSIDYTNFKAACANSAEMAGATDELHHVWATMQEYQGKCASVLRFERQKPNQ